MQLVGRTALDTLDRIQAADVRDVRGFARPRRDRAGPRNDDDETFGGKRRSTVAVREREP
jgi:hypothetical protein